MKILAIETSCDETSAAVVERKKSDSSINIISQTTATSLALHAKTGGIIPEIAARKQVEYIIPVIEKTLQAAKLSQSKNTRLPNQFDLPIPNIDAIAITNGPGLIGSLLVGVETAKTLSYLWNKPLIPINHLYGHIYANFISDSAITSEDKRKHIKQLSFPILALVVSGGHTDLVLLKNHSTITVIGGTRDDAAGECFDKCARLLGYPYPGGPEIAKLAAKGNPKAFAFPRPMLGSDNFDFSFSGLKTAFLNETKKHENIFKKSGRNTKIGWTPVTIKQNLKTNEKQLLFDLCASLELAIITVLVKKTILAAQVLGVKTIAIGGGVAANQLLRIQLQKEISGNELSIKLSIPPKELCTDNAAMIGACAFFNYQPIPWQEVTANPELYFD